jgi:hypothetical protein
MAWDVRGDLRYFYRSQRIGDTVKRVYVGSGEVAKRAAAKDAAAKAKRAADQAELITFEAKMADVDQLTAEVRQGVDLLTEAVLLSLGFHEHRGQWRRHRNVD